MVPFDAESYLRLIAAYNQAYLPVHLGAVGLGLVALALTLWPRPGGGHIVAGILALFWLWSAAIFHAQEFAVLNWAAPAFGLVFALQALLLAWTGVLRGRLLPGLRAAAAIPSLLLITVAVAGWPLLDLAAGSGWPAVRLFPVAPAPLAVFTLGLLIACRAPRHLLALPLLWMLFHGWAASRLGLTAEALVSGLACLATIAAVALHSRPRDTNGRPPV